MSGNKPATAFSTLLLKYNELPYVAIKKSSKYYLIPHKPSRPSSVHFEIAASTIKEYSLKYNQYFSSEKLWQKVSSKFESQISESDKTQQMQNYIDYRQKMKQFVQSWQQYFSKYKEPLKLMSINRYILFKKEFFRKKREAAQLLKNNSLLTVPNDQQLKQNLSNVPQTNNLPKKIYKNKSTAILDQINSQDVYKIWNNMTPQEKQVYSEMEEREKSKYQHRVRQFIQNHEVPVVSRFSVISRYISRYAILYNLRITDPQLYVKFRQISIQERMELCQEAKQMNIESKKRYQNFLLKWNISKEQLNYIIETSDNYRKARKEVTKLSRSKKYIENDKHQFADQEDDFQESDKYSHFEQ